MEIATALIDRKALRKINAAKAQTRLFWQNNGHNMLLSVDMWNTGKNIPDIAKILKISTTSVITYLHKSGQIPDKKIKERSQAFKTASIGKSRDAKRKSLVDRTLILWDSGLAVSDIAKEIGKSGTTIRNWLTQNGIVDRQNRQPLDIKERIREGHEKRVLAGHYRKAGEYSPSQETKNKLSRIMKEKWRKGEYSFIPESKPGRVVSAETREKNRIATKRAWADGKHGEYDHPFFRPGEYNGKWFRCLNSEGGFAFLLDMAITEWQYEPERFDLGWATYRPDFYLPKYDLWIEVKGQVTETSIKKLEDFRSANHNIVMISSHAVKKLLKQHFGIRDFTLDHPATKALRFQEKALNEAIAEAQPQIQRYLNSLIRGEH